jgi:PAS domain S-box-containing protein
LESPQINVSGIQIQWDPEEGTCTFAGNPVAMMWVDSTLKGLLAGIQSMVGTPRFELALQSEGRRSVEQDWPFISQAESFEEGFRAIAVIAAVAGWGRWELLDIDREQQQCRFRATNTWESRFQEATGLECDSALVAGKLAGYCSRLFGVSCWADQTAYAARGDPHDEFLVQPSDRTIEEESRQVLETDWVPRADMEATLDRLREQTRRAVDVTESLRASEQQYRLLAENVSDVIWMANLDMSVNYVSPSVQRLLGLTVEEAIAQPLSEILQPESIAKISTLLAEKLALAEAGDDDAWEPVMYDAQQPHTDGTIIITDNHAKLLKGPDGKPSMILGVTRDITERRLAEKAARRFRLAANSTSDIMAGLSRDSRFLFANTAYLERHGLKESDILGHHYSEVVGNEAYARFVPLLERCLAGEEVQFETILAYPNIGRRHMAVKYSPLMQDGACVGLVGGARDITESKAVTEALEYETRLRRILGDLANNFINLPLEDLNNGIQDALRRIAGFVDADRSYVILFDHERSLWTNTHEWCKEGIEPQIDELQELDLEPVREFLSPVLQQQIVDIECVDELPDEHAAARAVLKEQAIQSLLLAPLVSGGDVIGMVGFDFVSTQRTFTKNETRLLELTGATISQALARLHSEKERVALEEQLRHAMKIQAVGQLAGGVAHDFNNMLCAITSTTELLLQILPSEDENRELIEEISTAADRAADLTRQLLSFSRKQVLTPQVVNLNEVIERLYPMLERLLGEDIVLRIEPHTQLGSVHLDISLLEQVVVNLAVNSRDAMPTGGTLVIKTANVTLDEADCVSLATTEPGPYVTLVVSDTGIGMSDSVRERIFEPFFTTKTLGRGTGLGLATVDGIVEQSGGRIEVNSEKDHGTSFQVFFPRVDDARSALREPDEPGLQGGDETVLLVEDDRTVRASVVKLLTFLGYNVLVASNSAQAITLAEGHGDDIHLLLTDVVMPEMDGRELADHLLARLPGLKVLYASGYTQDVIAHHGVLKAGVHFVAKPFTLNVLATRIRETLSGDGPGRP